MDGENDSWPVFPVEDTLLTDGNETAEPPAELAEQAITVVTSVAVAVSLLCICLLCNLILITALIKRRHRRPSRTGSAERRATTSRSSRNGELVQKRPNLEALLLLIAVISAFNGILSATFQIPSLLYGAWIFGDALCQFQGFTTSLFALCGIWYTALLGMERYFFFLEPQEYTLTMSRINLRVIGMGLFFLLLTAVSGPLYGWGEYLFQREIGLCLLDMSSYKVVSYFSMSVVVYVVVPNLGSAFFYMCLLIRSKPDPMRTPQSDAVLTGRSSVCILAIATLVCFLLETPAYIMNVLQCCGRTIPPLLQFVLVTMQHFGVYCCFSACCVCFHSNLRCHLPRFLICCLRTNCDWIQPSRSKGERRDSSSRRHFDLTELR